MPSFASKFIRMKYIIINGPNLNLLGVRQPEIYGLKGFDTYFSELQAQFPTLTLEYFQSNHEGELVSKLQEVGFTYQGIVLNAAAYTHTSVAIGDVVAAVTTPVVEVHISNIHAREAFRHHSYVSAYAAGVIVGCGLEGYRLGIEYLRNR